MVGGLFLASAMRFGTVQASTGDSGIPKLSVPEFTVEFGNYVYLEVRIKNQPLASYHDNISNAFYYNIRAKPHSSEQWTGLYHAEDGYATPSDSEYTVITVGYLEENGISLWAQTRKILDVPSSDQVDFQVEAMIGHLARAGGPPFFDWQLVGETSGWSVTQTIPIPTPSPAPTPSLATPERDNAILGLVILALVVGAVLLSIYFKERNKQSKPKQSQAQLSRWQ
jgi:hypothetical protein